MTSMFSCRVTADAVTGTVSLDLMLHEPNAPDITIELEPTRARDLAHALLTAADKVESVIVQ